jgi:hypothetical protein
MALLLRCRLSTQLRPTTAQLRCIDSKDLSACTRRCAHPLLCSPAAPAQPFPHPPAPAALAAPPPAGPPLTCPGIAAGACALPCQLATCGALSAFYRASNNASSPWKHPWEPLKSQTCAQLVPRAGSPPSYCSWHGVRCCAPADLAAGRCWAVNAVANLTLKAASINGSISDPALMDAVEQLHACGLVGLDIESNDISGELMPRWGRLTNLTVLDLGERGCGGWWGA